MSGDWKRVAQRGQLALIVMSRERARVVGAQIHPDAEVVGELRPDDAAPLHVCFASFEALLTFIGELQPRTLTIECASGEDRAALEVELFGPGAVRAAAMAPRNIMH